MKIYLVGGAVRDKLLGRPVADRDFVVVGATPEDMLECGFEQVGADFPVFLHPFTRSEFALARQERKTAPGYHGFETISDPSVTLEDDLRRRDLTINAMAVEVNATGFDVGVDDPDMSELIDPFGGQRDLQDRVLRHVSSAFAEDPVRVLRVARFAARYNFTVADETMRLMHHLVEQGEMDHLTPERVWAEFEKALAEDHPVQFFWKLRECDALEQLFPGLHRGIIFNAAAVKKAALRIPVRCRHDLLIRMMIVFVHMDKDETQKLLKDLKAPRDVMVSVRRMHDLYPLLEQLRQGPFKDDHIEVMSVLSKVDAFRNPSVMMLLARAVDMMQCTFDDAMDTVLRAHRAAQSVTFATLPAEVQQADGATVGVELWNKRLEAAKAAM